MTKWIENCFNPSSSYSEERYEEVEVQKIYLDSDDTISQVSGYFELESEKRKNDMKKLKLVRAIQLCQDSHLKRESQVLNAFKEWKRLGIKHSLDALIEYSRRLNEISSQQEFGSVKERTILFDENGTAVEEFIISASEDSPQITDEF